jgi:hypothetical protein
MVQHPQPYCSLHSYRTTYTNLLSSFLALLLIKYGVMKYVIMGKLLCIRFMTLNLRFLRSFIKRDNMKASGLRSTGTLVAKTKWFCAQYWTAISALRNTRTQLFYNLSESEDGVPCFLQVLSSPHIVHRLMINEMRHFFSYRLPSLWSETIRVLSSYVIWFFIYFTHLLPNLRT